MSTPRWETSDITIVATAFGGRHPDTEAYKIRTNVGGGGLPQTAWWRAAFAAVEVDLPFAWDIMSTICEADRLKMRERVSNVSAASFAVVPRRREYAATADAGCGTPAMHIASSSPAATAAPSEAVAPPVFDIGCR
jgi:hypothetical protein